MLDLAICVEVGGVQTEGLVIGEACVNETRVKRNAVVGGFALIADGLVPRVLCIFAHDRHAVGVINTISKASLFLEEEEVT